MANVPLRPLGAKFYGVFHSVKTGDAEGNDIWVDWNFARDWEPQIVAAKSIGANLFCHMGHTKWVGDASITLATYLARRKILADYLVSVGMYSMPYLTGPFHQWGVVSGALGTTTNAQTITVLESDAALMAKYENVVGLITMDEPWLGYSGEIGNLTGDQVVANITAQYNAVKAVVPSNLGVCSAPNPGGDVFPYSAIFGYTGSGYDSTKGKCDSVAAFCDFFVYHPFYEAAAADSSAVRAAYPGKQLVLPSSILALDADSQAFIEAKTAAVMDLVTDNSWCPLMGQYACNDAAGGTAWGMFNRDASAPYVLTPRTTKTNAFVAGLPAVVAPAHPVRMFAGNSRLNQHVRWGYL